MTMSLLSVEAKPKEEASKPIPSSRVASVTAATGRVSR